MNTPTPRACASVHDGQMVSFNCTAVAWALDQNVPSASASRLLIEIARRSSGGRCASTQIVLGTACKLSERQTRTLLASLVDCGVVKRTRQGGAGQGRQPDVYELVGYVESQAEEQPAETADWATGNGQSLPVAPLATGNFDRQKLPVEATGNASPTPPYIKTTTSNTEVSSDRPELGVEGGLGETPFALEPPRTKTRKPRRAARQVATEDSMPAEMTIRMVSDAAAAGYVNGSGQALFRQWRDGHIAKGTEIANHEASFRTWIGNAPKFGNPPPKASARSAYAGIRPNPYIQRAKHC